MQHGYLSQAWGLNHLYEVGDNILQMYPDSRAGERPLN